MRRYWMGLTSYVFQSTRPRGARLQWYDAGEWLTLVSIHAPARGATTQGQQFIDRIQVSIHAPARGAT